MYIPDVRVLLAHTDHDTLVSRATNNRTDLVSSIHVNFVVTYGKTARGASSPAKPALHIPEPLSMTKAATESRLANAELLLSGMNVPSSSIDMLGEFTNGKRQLAKRLHIRRRGEDWGGQ